MMIVFDTLSIHHIYILLKLNWRFLDFEHIFTLFTLFSLGKLKIVYIILMKNLT